jgi:peptide/nickel transport system substrate-binding protein
VKAERAAIDTRKPGHPQRVTRKTFLNMSGAGLIGVGLFGVAGCGGGNGGSQQGGNGGGSGGDGGGNNSNLVVQESFEPSILNPFITGGDAAATADVTAGILEQPFQLMPDLTYSPKLADGDARVVSEDPQVIEFKLKDGLKWSDGKPLTSADLKWTYEQIMDEKNKIISRTGWEKIERFETPDDLTVKMVFKESYAPWRDLWGAGASSSVLPRHVYEGKDFNRALNNEIVGSGPFKLREWNKGQNLVIERNENYWGEAPKLDTVTYRFISDTNTTIAALESGEVQFIYPGTDVGIFERLRRIEGTKVLSRSGGIWAHMSFNNEKLNNKKMRQAIAYGINRQQIIDEVLKGQDVNPLQSVIVPQLTEYYTPAWERYAYDPDRARQLVREAESEGASSTIQYSTSAGAKINETIQQIVQSQLKDVGINIQIKNADPTTLLGERLPKGDFEIITFTWLTTGDPQITTLFSANQLPPKGQNYILYKNERVTRDLEESDGAVEVAERARLLKDAQERMAEDCPILPLYQRPDIYAFSDRLKGPEVNPSLAGPFWNIGDWSLSG